MRERTRDDVLREFGLDGLPDWLDVWAEAGRCRDTDGENVRRMTDEIVRLRAALTAASEPVSNAYTLPTPAPAEATGEDDPTVLHEIDDWHEDFGDALWWADGEPPYCGTPLDSDFPHELDGDHSCLGWSRLVIPPALTAASERREEEGA